jgi:hypothetical protein
MQWEDAVLVRHDDVLDFNDENILPQTSTTITKIRAWLQPTDFDGEGSEYQKHLSLHLSGTVDWVLASDAYREWHTTSEHGMLWVRGRVRNDAAFSGNILTPSRHSRLGKIRVCCVSSQPFITRTSPSSLFLLQTN